MMSFVTSVAFCQLPADNTIELKYVSSTLKTQIPIEPSKFDGAFASGMYTDTVVNKPELFAKLWNSYKEVGYGKEPKTRDIRYKITLYFSVYTPPLVIYMNAYFDTFDEKGTIVKGSFLKTLHHLVDAIIYKKKI